MQLLYFGIKEPEEFDNDHWSHKYRNWLDDMVFKHPTAKATLDSRMRFFRFVDQELRDVSTQLRRYCKTNYKKDYLLLRSIPGIGGIVACGILCELGDLRRFNNVKPNCTSGPGPGPEPKPKPKPQPTRSGAEVHSPQVASESYG